MYSCIEIDTFRENIKEKTQHAAHHNNVKRFLVFVFFFLPARPLMRPQFMQVKVIRFRIDLIGAAATCTRTYAKLKKKQKSKIENESTQDNDAQAHHIQCQLMINDHKK